MNRNRPRWILTGALCLALWSGATHGQTDALTKDDPCAAPNVQIDARPNAGGHFTRLDLFIIGSNILVFLALLQSVFTSHLVAYDRQKVSVPLDRVCRFAFPLTFAVMMVFVFLG